MLFVLHPKSLMHFIIKIKTQQFSIAKTNGLSPIIVNILPDKRRPVLEFDQLLIWIMWLNHITLEILHDKLKQLNSFLSKSKLKMLINLSHVLHVVIHTIWIVVVVEKTFQVIPQKTEHYCVY